jgi:carboxymethylenebutenolidase
VPLVAVIGLRDGLLTEHIYWDQATALAQVGLLDSVALPETGVEHAQAVAQTPRRSCSTRSS